MPVSDADYQAWLESPSERRVVLAELTHAGGTEYLSNRGYITASGDTPASTPYPGALLEVPYIAAGIDGRAALGDMLIVNDGGDKDAWFARKWAGHPVRLYLGDPAWARADFRLIVDGLIDQVLADGGGGIRVQFYDQRRKFDALVQSTELADGAPAPIAWGSVFNATPRLIDAATHTYQVHDDACTVAEVREGGTALGSVTDNGDGTFSLTASPSNQITADVEQATNTTAGIVQAIAAKIGVTAIDTASMSAFPNTATVGLFLRDATRAAYALDALLEGTAGWWAFDRLGQLIIGRLEIPASPSKALGPGQIVERGVEITRVDPPFSKTSLGYRPNETRQVSGLAGALSEADRALYGEEHALVHTEPTLVGFPFAVERELIRSRFKVETDAQAECDRRATLRSENRITYRVTCKTAPFSFALGDGVTLTYPRYGLDAGVACLVVGIEDHPTRNRCVLELLA